MRQIGCRGILFDNGRSLNRIPGGQCLPVVNGALHRFPRIIKADVAIPFDGLAANCNLLFRKGDLFPQAVGGHADVHDFDRFRRRFVPVAGFVEVIEGPAGWLLCPRR